VLFAINKLYQKSLKQTKKRFELTKSHNVIGR